MSVFDILELNLEINKYYGYLDQVIVLQSILSKEMRSLLNKSIECYIEIVPKRHTILDDRTKLKYLYKVEHDRDGNFKIQKLYTMYYKFDVCINNR